MEQVKRELDYEKISMMLSVSCIVVLLVIFACAIAYVRSMPEPETVLYSVRVYSNGVLIREWDAAEILINIHNNGPLRVYDEKGVHYVRGEYVIGPAE